MKRSMAVAVLAACLAGCGGPTSPSGTASKEVSKEASKPVAANGIPAACLDESTIGGLVGFTVHIEHATIKQSADAVNCTFLADDQTARPGSNVSILVAPASYATVAFADIRDSAARAKAKVQPVSVGADGQAYESAQRTAAATIVGQKLVAVTIDGMGLSTHGVGVDTAIELVRKIAAKAAG